METSNILFKNQCTCHVYDTLTLCCDLCSLALQLASYCHGYMFLSFMNPADLHFWPFWP